MTLNSGTERALTWTGAILAATVTVELLVRFFIQGPVPTTADPAFGWMMRPRTSYLYGTEGFSRFRTNSLGLNDIEPPADLSKAVLVIGDSYVEAVQVARSRNFAAVFRRLYAPATIVTAGRSGLSPLAYPALAARVTRSSRPRNIVVILNPSDVHDLRAAPADFKLDSKGTVTGIDSREVQRPQGADAAAFRFLVSRFGIAALVNHKYIETLKDWAASVRQTAAGLMGHRGARHAPAARAFNDAQLSQAAALLLGEMKQGAPVKLIFVPMLDYHGGGGVTETDASREARTVFANAAAAARLPLLNLEPALIAEFRRTGIPPNGFNNTAPGEGHLNDEGHGVLARAIAAVTDTPGAGAP